MRKRVAFVMFLCLCFALSACNSNKETASSSDNKELSKKGITIISGQGKPIQNNVSEKPSLYLHEGTASISAKLSDAPSGDAFSVRVFTRIIGSGTSTELASVFPEGNSGDEEDFDVTESGYYEIDIRGEDLPEDYNGNWEIKVQQAPENNSEYKKQLRVSSFTENIGGTFASSFTPAKYDGENLGYGKLVNNMKIDGSNSLSFQTINDGDEVYENSLINGKWTNKEKETSKELPINQLYDVEDGASSLFDVSTSKGSGKLVTYNDKFAIVFDEPGIKNKELNVNDLFKTVVTEMNVSSAYYDFKSNIVYLVGSNPNPEIEADTVLYRYDIDKQDFILDNSEEPASINLPFESTANRVIFSKDTKGNLYIGSIVDAYTLSVAVYDKNAKIVAEPVNLYSTFDYNGKGRLDMKATNNGVDIWNVYDTRLTAGDNYSDDVNVGVNKYSLILQ